MNWVRIHPFIANWPGGGPPPVFEITADENGTAVVEIAWDPQALKAPATYTNPLRYYSTNVVFSATITRDNGSSLAVNVPAQTIQLSGNRATWAMPAALWEAYREESLKALRTPPASTFSRNLYYRVRVTPAGSSTAHIWPPDAVLTGANSAAAPHIGLLAMSAAPASQVVPDTAAIQAMGGISLVPTLWSDLLTMLWNFLPATDPGRQALVALFAHQVYLAQSVAFRAKLLKLWLFAGPTARPRVHRLLDRRVVTGANTTQPAVLRTDYLGTNTLVDNLLSLLSIIPHPDIVSSSTRNVALAREQLLDDVIDEILDPNGQVNQGEAGTCAPTSMQTLLITVNPAEYARLQLGLLSAAGTVQMADGSTVTVPPAIFQVSTRYPGATAWAFLVRNFSELAFQATVLKFGLGGTFPAYNPSAPPNAPNGVNTVFQATVARGLIQDQMERALEGLFKANFTTRSVRVPADAGWPPYATIQTRQAGVRDALRTALPGRLQPVILGMYWNALPNQPNPGGHAVLALRAENGRVFFKNPQYSGLAPAPGIAQGGNGANPPRRFEDPTGTLESMTDADLANWILWFHVPDQAVL
ncbi:MAG TPA: hypothetical protein VLT87_25795 [Thermoanaerobaculia bacterium]|nr:hypothetical protein [Thermoanaerobaculia bacterium]